MTKGSEPLITNATQENVELNNLFLDPKNPRLPYSINRSQKDMLEYLAKYTSIEDLMNAIGENDYFVGEPLITFKDDGKYYVVEGNRRLTALKLLSNPLECSRPSAKIIEISNNAKFKPQNIPVILLNNRIEALPYLGYRHITGVKQWEPLAKARYIKDVFDTTDIKISTSERYKEVADTIGSRKDHIKRNLEALAVYNVIEENDFFNIENLNESSIKFAVLSTALADNRISDFVGISQDNSIITNPDSLDEQKIKEITRWIYEKDSKGNTRLGESRNLRQLAAVLSNSRALEAFRRNITLQSAYRLTNDIGEDFISYLYEAENAISEAASVVATVEFNEEAYDAIVRISKHTKLIGNTLKHKKSDNEDEF